MELNEVDAAFESLGEGLYLVMVGLDQLKRRDKQSEESMEVLDFVVVDTEVLHLGANDSNIFGQLN